MTPKQEPCPGFFPISVPCGLGRNHEGDCGPYTGPIRSAWYRVTLHVYPDGAPPDDVKKVLEDVLALTGYAGEVRAIGEV